MRRHSLILLFLLLLTLPGKLAGIPFLDKGFELSSYEEGGSIPEYPVTGFNFTHPHPSSANAVQLQIHPGPHTLKIQDRSQAFLLYESALRARVRIVLKLLRKEVSLPDFRRYLFPFHSYW